MLNENPGRPTCTYNCAVSTEREKEICDDAHDVESTVWDVTSQTIATQYDIIVTSSRVCASEPALSNALSSLKSEGFLVLLSAGDTVNTDAVAECVASRESAVARLELLRKRTTNVSKEVRSVNSKYVTVAASNKERSNY